MNVLMTADTVGGVWSYALELTRALELHGVTVVLATMGAPLSPAQRRELAAISNIVEASTFKLEWMQDPWSDVDRAGEWLLALERKYTPDVVHLNGYVHASLPWAAPVLVVGHSCVRSWWTAVRGAPTEPVPSEWDDYTQRVRAGIRSADLVAAPTQAMLDALEEHYGPLPPTEVIPNGRAAQDYLPGIKENLIFSAGRIWDEGKNIGLLARAAARLPWPVATAGSLESPDGDTTDLNGTVRWLGRIGPAELAAWMGRASVYALPARYEPFGLSALEAALAGCTLVLGDIPSLHEVWGDAAYFVPPDDEDALVATIRLLCADRTMLRDAAKRARARALELTPQRMAAMYVNAYGRLRDAGAAEEVTACGS